ncbi:MAG: pentapeptide repeat-containing protein [Synechococcaceae cyanobacterium RM1_1_27]|nr:pentapeptide repeat-containing protein [Synechococcaceae cyanobacterium RM1_1_27]
MPVRIWRDKIYARLTSVGVDFSGANLQRADLRGVVFKRLASPVDPHLGLDAGSSQNHQWHPGWVWRSSRIRCRGISDRSPAVRRYLGFSGGGCAGHDFGGHLAVVNHGPEQLSSPF